MKKIILMICIFLSSFEIYSQIEINVDAVWDSPQNATTGYGDGITIKDNATLVISCPVTDPVDIDKKTFTFGQGAEIVIEPGSRLICENSILTTAIYSIGWQGIIVQGNPNLDQDVIGNNRNQGLLILRKNAEITCAGTGVLVKGGGVIFATDATFYECVCGVEFEEYSYAKNRSYLRNNFLISRDESFRYVSLPLYYHVKVSGCNGIRFERNTFEFENVSGSDNHQGIGIKAQNSSIIVQKSLDYSWVPTACTRNGSRNTFINLIEGISVGGNFTGETTKITQSTFENCEFGIDCCGDNGTIIYDNDFTWDNQFIPENNLPNGILQPNPIIDMPDACGILYYHSKDFVIIKNFFDWDLVDIFNMGYYFYGIAGAHNEWESTISEIFKNTFQNNIYFPDNRNYIVGILTDVSPLVSNQQAQLYISCNDFYSLAGMHVLYAKDATVDQRIINQEGKNYSQDVDANNDFDIYMILTPQLFNINTGLYYYKTNNSGSITSGAITLINNSINYNACNDPNPCNYINSPLSQYSDAPQVDEINPDVQESNWRRLVFDYDSMYVVDDPPEQIQRKKNTKSSTDINQVIQIYPNPADNYFFVNFNSEKKIETITFYNLFGKNVLSKTIHNYEGQLYFENGVLFSNGMYLLRINYEDGSYNYRNFIVE